MTEILESVMLICFGLSWPISVRKNYRARTTKGCSLWFILLIITGYIAGITAKIIDGRINYVLAVYAVNLIMVVLNLVVYFRNRALDRISDNSKGESFNTCYNDCYNDCDGDHVTKAELSSHVLPADI